MRPLLALGLLALVSSTAWAQDDREAARVAFDAGRQALERGEHGEAVRELERSLRLFPYLPTAYNLAIARTEAGDPVGAALLTQSILEGRYGNLEPAERRQAQRLARELRPKVGRVRITVTGVDDPWLRVDGLEQRVATDEPRLLYVEPGRHDVAIGAENVRAHRVALRVDPGELAEMRVDLSAPPRGTLRVAGPEGEQVEIVGVDRGPSPLERDLPVGVYQVGIDQLPGSRVSVSVVADRVLDVAVEPPPRRWPRVVGGVAAAVVAVGAALAIGFAVARGGSSGPEEDPVFGTIEALRAPVGF